MSRVLLKQELSWQSINTQADHNVFLPLFANVVTHSSRITLSLWDVRADGAAECEFCTPNLMYGFPRHCASLRWQPSKTGNGVSIKENSPVNASECIQQRRWRRRDVWNDRESNRAVEIANACWNTAEKDRVPHDSVLIRTAVAIIRTWIIGALNVLKLVTTDKCHTTDCW